MADSEWDAFKSRYVMSDGRVIDTVNGGISHSESQGLGMLFALDNNDSDTFSKVWFWTRANLQIRNDHFFSWKWSPHTTPSIVDENNAADGDILIAWALYLAYERWGDKRLRQSADYIVKDIKLKLLRATELGLVLLPGETGFEFEDRIVVNLSYWVFPAFLVFERYQPGSQWQELRTTGLRLLEQARYGRWDLPPDWLMIKGARLSVASEGFKPNFGYDAVRIPLYLVWAKEDSQKLLRPFYRFWSHFNGKERLPDWVNLNTGGVSSHQAPLGMYAIKQLVDRQLASQQDPYDWTQSGGAQEGYYSAGLRLMVRMARL